MSRFFSTANAPSYIKSSLLYERKAVTDVWNRLTLLAKQQWKWKNADQGDPAFMETPRRLVQVYGPPGSGKSTAVFRWTCRACETCRIQAHWIACAAEEDQGCWKINAVNGNLTVEPFVPPQRAQDLSGSAIVVFDGVRQSTLERWRGSMNALAREGVTVAVVSSEGVRFHEGDSQDIVKLQHFVPSWTLSEYFAASDNAEFWERCYEVFHGGASNDHVNRRQQLVQEKFKLAGHSARFMFRSVEHAIKQRIKQDALAMGGMDSLEEAVRNIRSVGAVNTVVARLQDDKNGITPQQEALLPTSEDFERAGLTRADFMLQDQEFDIEEPVSRIVSAFAANQVAKNIPSSIGRLRRVAHTLRNRVIEGYAFEEQLKKSLGEAANPGRHLSLSDIDGRSLQLQVDRFMSCDKPNLEGKLKGNWMKPNTWIFVAGQQGAFDAVHIQSPTHLRFVQATVGQKHTFYLDVIDLLLQRLAASNVWSHIEFLLLRPSDEQDQPFDLDPARGKLQKYKRFDETDWDQRDYRRSVVYNFLDWTEYL